MGCSGWEGARGPAFEAGLTLPWASWGTAAVWGLCEAFFRMRSQVPLAKLRGWGSWVRKDEN